MFPDLGQLICIQSSSLRSLGLRSCNLASLFNYASESDDSDEDSESDSDSDDEAVVEAGRQRTPMLGDLPQARANLVPSQETCTAVLAVMLILSNG